VFTHYSHVRDLSPHVRRHPDPLSGPHTWAIRPVS